MNQRVDNLLQDLSLVNPDNYQMVQEVRKLVLPPVPFSGKFNAIARLLLEQWVNFPRFVLSGGWLRAFRENSPN